MHEPMNQRKGSKWGKKLGTPTGLLPIRRLRPYLREEAPGDQSSQQGVGGTSNDETENTKAKDAIMGTVNARLPCYTARL